MTKKKVILVAAAALFAYSRKVHIQRRACRIRKVGR